MQYSTVRPTPSAVSTVGRAEWPLRPLPQFLVQPRRATIEDSAGKYPVQQQHIFFVHGGAAGAWLTPLRRFPAFSNSGCCAQTHYIQ